MSIALSVGCCKPSSTPGNAGSPSVTTDRVVRPFDWGLDWIPANGNGHPGERPAAEQVRDWVDRVMTDTDAFFTPPPTTRLHTVGSIARRRSPADVSQRLRRRRTPRTTPCTCRYVRSAQQTAVRRAPPSSCCRSGTPTRTATSGLCRLLNWNGMSALRLSLPYHDQRMPPELHRADYIVSANVARTVQVCRQAVLDARRAIAWLAAEGYERIGILGTSLGSCLALLTTAHEPLVRARGAQSHLAALRRRRLARTVDRARAAGARRPRRSRHAARAVEADQPALVSRPAARSPDAARVRAVRPDVSGRSVRGSRARVPRTARPARGRRAAVRALQHGQDAVQVSRRLDPDAVSEEGAGGGTENGKRT